MKNYLISLLLLNSCHYSVNKEKAQTDEHVISTTEQAWIKLNYPNHKDCLGKVIVRTASAENFDFVCGTSAKLSIGCIRDRKDGTLSKIDKVIYLSPEVHPNNRERALVQLTLHTLCNCTYNDEDRLQLAPGVWRQSDGEQSVEALALSNLGL